MAVSETTPKFFDDAPEKIAMVAARSANSERGDHQPPETTDGQLRRVLDTRAHSEYGRMVRSCPSFG